jgi:CRP-like cAMP-binding protein
MLLKDEVELLRQVPLFQGIDPGKLKLLAFTSERMAFEPGQIMVQQGDPGDAAYLILKGRADVLVKRNARDIKVAEIGANAIVGEIAILCDVPRTATVKAVDRLETLRIGKEHFLRMLTEYPEMAIQIMRVLADRLGKTTAELTDARAKGN